MFRISGLTLDNSQDALKHEAHHSRPRLGGRLFMLKTDFQSHPSSFSNFLQRPSGRLSAPPFQSCDDRLGSFHAHGELFLGQPSLGPGFDERKGKFKLRS